MERKFIRIHNKLVHTDAISYVELLDSGRAMIIVHGLPLEKQHIQVDVAETLVLREMLEPLTHNPSGTSMASAAAGPQPTPMRRYFNDR